MTQIIKIDEVQIAAGEEKTIHLQVAQLPSRTAITIPVTIYRSSIAGPTLLLMAGLHGDEINGIEIVRRIINQKYHYVERGTTITIPIVNVFGFINFSREVPDGKDVNRSFPGYQDGSLASKVAYEISNKILPLVDYGIDFHTGGAQRSNFPQVRADLSIQKNKELANVFAAPFTVHSSLINKSLRKYASDLDIPMLVYEGGESLRFKTHAIQEGIDGSLRVMNHLHMRNDSPKPHEGRRTIHKRTWLRSPQAGLWIHKCKEGDFVRKGQLLGYTASPYGEERADVYSEEDGYIIGLNYSSVVHRGDALIHLGTEWA